MACLCGDICCPSCGPAQGNYRCIICRAWASDECEHLDPEQGDHAYRPEFREQVAAAERAAMVADAQEEAAAQAYEQSYREQEVGEGE